MAGKGGRAAHGVETEAQCGASACMSAVGIGSVLRDVFIDGTLLGFRGVLISGTACKHTSFLRLGSDLHGGRCNWR